MENTDKKNSGTRKYTEIIGLCVIIILMFSGYGFCREKIFDKVKGSVDAAITIRRNAQSKLDKWEREEAELVAEYDRLKQEQTILEQENRTLLKERQNHKERLDSLVMQTQENLKIQKNMLPFLHDVVGRLSNLISGGLPFLVKERSLRIQRLKKIVDDPDTGIADKYRKTMEALFIEAGYGNSTEVVREKIVIGGNEVLEDIFRLGRISLFALSLDHKSAAYFNIIENRWHKLDKKYVEPVYAAIEISRKRRTAELVSLPIGRLAN